MANAIRCLTALQGAMVICTLASLSVYAQTPPAAPRPVTRDELRLCMNSEGELAAKRQALETQGKRNGEELTAIRAEATELATEREALQERPASRDRFERKARTHNQRVKAAQATAESFRAELESLNKTLGDYNGRCGLISFTAQDREAILQEHEAAKK